CDNAEAVVTFLQGHPGVTAVHYPGLPAHPNHEVAVRQMRRFGGMVSFQVKGGEDVATKVCAETELWTLGESLGGVEALIEH
ncbi:PLP-dependent transferase, partial [Vibrio cholerae]|uniref:PLP-dependent transferase n=1 Tax=Vibrio cholerae TaxID=666 RepID=UPI00159FDDD2